MSAIRPRIASSAEFWATIESTYGEVPNLIRIILQVNGFNSFLALKGIRYDDKQEFFQSLELTVIDVLNSDCETIEKIELEVEVAAQYQNVENFRIKPGHKNYIMNLMLEIEKTDVAEFFERTHSIDEQQVDDAAAIQCVTPVKQEYAFSQVSETITPSKLIIRTPDNKRMILNQVEHGYSRDDQEDEPEYVFEEEYLTDDTMDSMTLIKIDNEMLTLNDQSKLRSMVEVASSSSAKRKPDHMYNEEFMAKCVNPRRRRVATNKFYPPTDEGTSERFVDLIRQSMQCILPKDKMREYESSPIQVDKETESSWAVYCPICQSRIRLSVVRENGGRYCNYKRSNFERHLRFKHCKDPNKSNKVSAANRSFDSVEEVIIST